MLKNILLGCIFFLLSVLIPATTFAADVCRGFKAGSTTLETGICYYGIDASEVTPPPAPTPFPADYTTSKADLIRSDGVNIMLPNPTPIPETCSQMTAADYHHTSAYHGISDEVLHCNTIQNIGVTYKCCAPDNQPTLGPPQPCTLDKNNNCTSVSTGLGNIQVDPQSIVGSVFGILLGLSGGIAIIIIMLSGYRIIFAHNDPEKLKGAREMLTSAIIGLLFIIFSVTILRIIGVDILHIPGLNK